MNKARLTAAILILLLTSCNLPKNQAASTPDIVATQVSMLLTNQPTLPLLTPTGEPQSSLTPEASVTLAATNTAETTATATTSPTDPREFLGSPDFIDPLDTGKSFGLENQSYDDDYTLIRVDNSSLILTSKYATGYHGWRTGGTRVQNAYIEAPMKIGDCSGLDTYGLVYRSPDYIKGYWFTLTCGGDWAFGYWNGEDYVLLADGSDINHAVLTGSNQTNRVGVMATGSIHKLYVNGKLIAEVADSTFDETGSFGAVIAAYSTPNFTLSISEFAYWTIE